MKKISTILCIVVASIVTKAQQTTNYVLANQGFTNGQTISTGNIEAGKLTYEALKNSSLNSPTYYTTGNSLRLYSNTTSGNGNSFEIKAITGVNINSVKIITQGKSGANDYAPESAVITVDGVVVPTVYDPSDTTNSTYLINAATPAMSIKIQNGQTGTSAQIRILSVDVTYTEGNLAIADFGKISRSNFVRNTFVKDDEIIFGADLKNIKIYTLNGQIVKSGSVKANERLNISELPKGYYIVTGTVDNQPISQKILKD